MESTQIDFVKALSNFSSAREKNLEHRFIAEVTSCLWRKGIFDFAVAHSEVDSNGYDIIMEANGVTRHIQLKASRQGGKTGKQGIQVRLGDKPSGCVVWMVHDPETLHIEQLLWFGGSAGQRLPDLGDKVVKHTKADTHGQKSFRLALRNVVKSRFVKVPSWQRLTSLLFALD